MLYIYLWNSGADTGVIHDPCNGRSVLTRGKLLKPEAKLITPPAVALKMS